VSLHGTRRQPSAEEAAVVGVIASTGGPKALARLFGELPPDFPAPILVVQHIIRGFSEHLAGWLDANSGLAVQEAMHGVRAKPGNIYVAPADTHLEIGPDRFLELNEGPPVGGHCPSGDLLLESLARHAGSRSVGIIMSGMGSDGTAGLAALHRSGGKTFVQDRKSSVVYGMPQSAIDLGVVDDVVELDDMASHLNHIVRAIHQGAA
jgi:two-component system chemotaxis response regulator CheB